MKDQLCTLLITFIDLNNDVKQITTAHTFASTDPRHYPQRRRVVHTSQRAVGLKRNDPQYVTVSRSSYSPQGALGSDMIERPPTYQPLVQSGALRQFTIQEVQLSYKCASAETFSHLQSLPRAGPLCIDYSLADDSAEGLANTTTTATDSMGTVQALPLHYASESNLYRKQQHFEHDYNLDGGYFDQEERYESLDQRKGISSESYGYTNSTKSSRYFKSYDEHFVLTKQKQHHGFYDHPYSEKLVNKSQQYPRCQHSPPRHSVTTFKTSVNERFQDDGIRLYARYDDPSSHQEPTSTDSRASTVPKLSHTRMEVKEKRYRNIAPGSKMATDSWCVPYLPTTIPPRNSNNKQQQRYQETQIVQAKRVLSDPVRLKPVVVAQKRSPLALPPIVTVEADEKPRQQYETNFQTFQREVERLKVHDRHGAHNVTVFEDKADEVATSPSLVTSPLPLPPPSHLCEEVIQQKIDHSKTIMRDPVKQTARSVTEFPVHEPHFAALSPPPPLVQQSQNVYELDAREKALIEEEAMRRFSEKLDILRNSKRIRHIRDNGNYEYSSTGVSARPISAPRTIEQIETIEIETEEYRCIPPLTPPKSEPLPVQQPIRMPDPEPEPEPMSLESSEIPKEENNIGTKENKIPPLRTHSPTMEVHSTTTYDETRHVRVEVTEEILTERIERISRRQGRVNQSEKEVQAADIHPEVFETATETIFLPGVDISTQSDLITIKTTKTDSSTQHEQSTLIDAGTDVIPIPTSSLEEVPISTLPPEIEMTDVETQFENKEVVNVSTQDLVPPPPIIVDSSTQSESPRIPTPPRVIQENEKIDVVETTNDSRYAEETTTTKYEMHEKVDVNVHYRQRKDSAPLSSSSFSSSSNSISDLGSRYDEYETYTSQISDRPYPARVTNTSTLTSAELKLKVSAKPPVSAYKPMEYTGSEYKSLISSRSGYTRQARQLEPNNAANRIIRIVSETTSIGSGGSYGNNSAALAVRDAREREKKEMSDLNDRLASYIEKVRFLEAQNRKLGADLEYLHSRSGHDATNVRDMYEIELREARKLIEESDLERDRLNGEITKIQIEINSYISRYEAAVRDHRNDNGVVEELLAKLSAIDSELTLLKRRINNLEDDINAIKRENHRLLGELQRSRTDIDQETLNRIDYQNQVQTILEELDFLRRAHESEIWDLQAIASRDTTNENREYFRNELTEAMREIRAEYDQKTIVQRSDMDNWYKMKVQEIVSLSVRQNMETGYTKEEMKRLRTQLGDTRGHLADLETRNSLLEKQAEELHYQIEDDQRTYESALNERDSATRKLREECHTLMVELQMLLDTKQTLDAEIAIYRKMLEGEEDRAGLRQLVESVVRTQQHLQSSQEIESHRILRGKTASRNSYQRSAKGNVSILESSPDGKFIIVHNTHRSKVEPIGGWTLKRSIDHKHEVVFTFPKSFDLKPGQSVKIWARGHGVHNPPESLVFDKEESFGAGNNVHTYLYNATGEERATLIQRTSHTTAEV